MRGSAITSILVSFGVMCLVATPGGKACPRRCTCYTPTEVHCTFRYLASIPDGIPVHVERINFGYNSLVRLTERDFSGLSKLELLMLHSNGIRGIAAKTFLDLHALQVLKMSYNKIQKLEKDTFQGLWSLTRLHMDHNNIEFINPEVFHGLTFLRLVHLEGNQLTKLHPDTFVSMSFLRIFKVSFIKYLYLSDNFLTTLPYEMISYMADLESLYLHGNPWSCDCHLQWLSDWIQEKPDVIKCKKDRGPSGAQQCPLCANPRSSKGKPLAAVPAAAFLCAKPSISTSRKPRNLTIVEDSAPASVSPQDFMAPFGSLTLNMTDQSGNEANMVCSIQKPSRTSPIAFTEEKDHVILNASIAASFRCSLDYSHIQPVWRLLALYSESPLVLERSHLLTETPQLCYKYKQRDPKPEDIFTNIEADLRADPTWLMQDQISLQLNRTATTLSTLQIQYSSETHVTLPRAEKRSVKQKWTMITRDNHTKLEHTVLVGETIGLDCPGQGDPPPHLQWLLADGSKVRAPYVSEDGRILIDENGKLELQLADTFDTGLYHCISTNYDDADILTYRITVVDPSMEAYQQDAIHHTVLVGETLDLPCDSSGAPDASSSWLLPGNIVLSESSKDKQILQNNTLRILQVTPKDQGHYCCIAANPSGVDFLIFQVSVKGTGQRPVQHDAQAEGSGLEESSPVAHLQKGPAILLPVAPKRPGLEKPISSTRKRHNFLELSQRRRGDPAGRRFREHRRHFPPSAQRIDPQHWAALLEKAKKNAGSDKRELTTARLHSAGTQLLMVPTKEGDPPGLLPPGEQLRVLAAKASSAPARMVTADSGKISQSPMTKTPSTQVSPVTSPQILPPENHVDVKLPTAVETTTRSKNASPAVSSKMQSTTTQESFRVFSLSPGTTDFQDADQNGIEEHSQSTISARTVIEDIHSKMQSSTSNAGAIFLPPGTATEGQQTPVPGTRDPSDVLFYPHTTPKTSTSTSPSDPDTVAPSQLQVARNRTADIPLPRRFGRRRKTWVRGRVISPHRTPALRRHRYGIVRPTGKGESEDSNTVSWTPEFSEICPSCPPRRTPVATTTTALSLSSSPSTLPNTSTLPNATIAIVIPGLPTTPVQNPSLLFENTSNESIQQTTPTIKYFSAANTQVTPTSTRMTYTPPSSSMEKNRKTNIGDAGVSSTSEANRDAAILSLPSEAITQASVPTSIAVTKFSRRKIYLNPPFVNNHGQKERLRNLRKYGLQKSAVKMLSKTSAASPTDQSAHFSMLSASLMQVPTVKFPTTEDSAVETHSPLRLPAAKELPHSPLYPAMPPTITSKKSSATSFLSGQADTLATPPTVLASAMIYKTQPGRRAQKMQRKKERQNRKDPNISPGQASGLSTSTARTSPMLSTATTSNEPAVSASTHSPLENTKGISSTAGLHVTAFNLTDIIEELPLESPQTLKDTIASQTTSSSQSHKMTTTRKMMTTHSTVLPLQSGTAIPVPSVTSPAFSQNTVTDKVAVSTSTGMVSAVSRPQDSPWHSPRPQQLAAEITPSWEAPADAMVTAGTTIGTTSFAYSNGSQTTPMPAFGTVKSQNPKWTTTPFSESPFRDKSHPETVEASKSPPLNTLSTLGSIEATPQASSWDRQKNAKKSGFEKPIQKPTTSKLFPFDSLLRNIFEKPRIVGGKAASFTVSANSDAFLPCEASGNPLPTIHWTRVSSGLDLSKRKHNSRFQVLPNGTLSIQKVDIEDRGQYLCSASNPYGTDYLHVTLSVVSYAPRILEKRTKEMTLHSGSSVELKCRAEGRPSPVISWILANQTVVSESSEGNRQALVTAEGTLVIHNISIYDRGFYKCTASNAAGQDSVLVKIQVIAAPPVILEQKRQVLVGAWGESLKLPCTAQGTPQPSVHWVLSDGTTVKPLQFVNSRLFLYPNGTLHIRNIGSSDRGTYECIATSSTGSERRVVILTVEEQDTIPRIEVASQKWTEVNFGDKLLLNCSATGEPKPQITWRLPSKAVVDQWHRMGSRIHLYPNGSLFIESVTEKDGGDYLCVARNKMGDDLTLMHVSLVLKPAKIDHKQHFRKQVPFGKDFQVDCKASGSPVPEISWSLPDGTVINSALQADSSRRPKRYTLFNNGTLYFNKVGITEEGDYTCYARNTLGKDEMKVHLTVITAAPRIRQGYKSDIKVKAGGTAVLDCEATGEPKPKVFWLLPSHNTISFSYGRYTFHANGSLTINKVRPLDSGEYLCVARNPSGDDTQLYKMDVVSMPPLINGLYRNRTVVKVTAVRHSKKHLDCRAEGTPPPHVTWIMPDNVYLRAPYHGGRITVHENGTLEIRNVRLSDSADFTCVAQNEGGESVLVVQLEVLEMLRRPTFRNPFNERIVGHLGKSTTLNCSVDGNPPPEILWILPNGTQFSNRPHDSQYLIARNGSFIIHRTTRKDAGKYRCAARNKVGHIEKLIILEIGQQPVILTYKLGIVKSMSGESLSLHCMSDGIPKPNIRWTTPSGYVIDRPRINGKYILHENGTLVIKQATTYDRGNYLCQAQNSAGHAQITVPVLIVAYPPRITNRPPRSILTRTGAPFQLYCVALGAPKPEITWEMPNHSLLSTASQGWTYGSEALRPQGTLLIQNPQTSDSGPYKCTARNALGSDSATTYIQVI